MVLFMVSQILTQAQLTVRQQIIMPMVIQVTEQFTVQLHPKMQIGQQRLLLMEIRLV